MDGQLVDKKSLRTSIAIPLIITFPIGANALMAGLVAWSLLRHPIGSRIDPLATGIPGFFIIAGAGITGIVLAIVATKNSRGRGKHILAALFCLVFSLTPLLVEMLTFNLIVSHRHLVVAP